MKTMKFWVGNLNAGLTVALVALPLAIAFGESSTLGAAAGITTAIVAGFIAAIFGGSNFQVSGPTGAMTVVLIPLAASQGSPGVLLAGLIAGAVLVLAYFLKLGRHIHKLPASVIEGFSAGIAIVIARAQLGWASPNTDSIILTVVVMIAVIAGLKLLPKWPISITVLALATLASNYFRLDVSVIPTLENPLGSWSTDFLGAITNWNAILIPALGIATLAAFEALLSAKIADRMAGAVQPHDSDRELLGQGLSNIAVPFLGGVPATAALARTAVNVRSGATSRVAAAAHSAFLLIMVLVLAPLVNLIPLPALAGVLLATAFNMLNFRELWKHARASKLDGILTVVTLLLTIFMDLTTALFAGVLMWLALRKTKLAQGEEDYDV
jgi:SulP family sulfate permease